MDNEVFCKGLTSSSEEGMCHIEENGNTFTFTYNYERLDNRNESVFLCNSHNDNQTQTINWNEFRISVEGMTLGNVLKEYFSKVRLRVRSDRQVFRMAPDSTFDVTCSIDDKNMSWTCMAHFKDAVMQMRYRYDTGVTWVQRPLNEKTYNISGKFELCEFKDNNIGKLQIKHIMLINTSTLYELGTEDPIGPMIVRALRNILSKGPTLVCG
ncbi:unnamed protein product [Dibothriocephalus latus]|uniref:Uncharacterized protein n=1 Tax=Dibothriocephalus latus TaxID=60516 RepID=A0A3P7LSV5_DIBLA|nr:unnamed protein product [Dibothriocephalus latus]